MQKNLGHLRSLPLSPADAGRKKQLALRFSTIVIIGAPMNMKIWPTDQLFFAKENGRGKNSFVPAPIHVQILLRDTL
jgi:hypothetical protein